MNNALFLRRAARAHPGAPALASGGRVLADYATLAARVARLAGALAGLGLAPGSRVALVLKNHPAYLELLLAAWHAGLVAVPIHSKLHPRELAFIFGNSGASAVFCAAGTTGACEEAAGLAPVVRHVIDVGGAAFAALFNAVPLTMVERGPDDLAWLFYTSGTTGRPKGVMLSHGNLLAMTLNYFTNVDAIARTDCIVHAAPMSHGSGIYLLPHLAQAALNVVPESGAFDPEEIFSLCRACTGVTMFAAPTMVKRMVDAPGAGPLPGLKTVVYGGGPMYVADIKAAIERFGQCFAQIYGQGESPMTITASPKAIHIDTAHPRYDARLGSVGLPFAGVEVMVADDEDNPLPAGAIGEICVRGPVVMRGYWNDAAASASALRRGWLHTGDVGAFDEEGFLTLKDRSKDLIISGGSNIYPREVEEALLLHPQVAEVSVVGRAHPEWGEEVVAFVVARAGTTPDRDALEAHCLDHIARFKRPKHYRFVATLPKNETGKVLKTALRQQLA
jgi:long-chain acyl-CoA synthetase